MQQFTSNWNYPTNVRFGCGRINELATFCSDLNIKKPMIVTDPQLAQLPFLKNIINLLNQPEVFTDIQPNPVRKNIIDGVKFFNDHNCDGIIAIGGGSSLDSAKTIALMSGQTGDLWDYEDVGDNFKRVDPNGIAPLIAIPTTSGTGSEVGRAALIIDEQQHSKRFIFHPDMTPNLVVADPELTVGLPAGLTAATGMDALAHNLEAYCAKGFHPMADGIAMEGMRLIKKWLPIAVADGSNLEARSELMAASIMGGTAFQKGLGAVHSLSHPVGAIYNLHHGTLNAIFMPYVVNFNKPIIEERLQRLAVFLGLKDADGIIDWLTELNHQFNIPTDLVSANVDEEHIDNIVEQAMNDPSTGGNPRECTPDDFRDLFLSALYGKVKV
jgi:alcohol dehydrogenase class IV